MRCRIALLCILCSSLLSLGDEPLHAAVAYPEVHVEATRPARLEVGAQVSIPVRIFVRNDLAFESVSLENARGWLLPELHAVPVLQKSATVPGYRVLDRELLAHLDRRDASVDVVVHAGGERYVETLDLGEVPGGTSTVIDVDDTHLTRRDTSQFEKVQPVRLEAEAERRLAKAARSVQVTGRILMRSYADPTAPTVFREAEGLTVRLISRGTFGDTEYGAGVTDVNGDYDFTAAVDGTPDLEVVVRAENSVINVGGRNTFFETYQSTLRAYPAFGGTSINIPARAFTGDMNAAAWLTSMFTRAHRWYEGHGYTLGKINARWPDDYKSVSWYWPLEGLRGMHITTAGLWNTRTLLHEYGHHFMYSFGNQVSPPQYCNNLCDYDGTCGHCFWCEENEAIAWSEGFPYWLSYQMAADISQTYGWGLPNAQSMEQIRGCGDKGDSIERSWSTEGILAAFIQDLTDSLDVHPDPAFDGTMREFSRVAVDDVLWVATDRRPHDSHTFVTEMRNALYIWRAGSYTDADRREFWAAAHINGFESDTVPPTEPTSLNSTSHPVGVMTGSNVPYINVSGGSDSDSGLDRYLITIDSSATSEADTIGTHVYAEVEDGLALWPEILPEGSYWIHSRSVDRAGNRSVTTVHYGPIVVGPPTPIDLVSFTPPLWEASIVARNDATATPAAAGFPPSLLGDTDVWFSVAVRNDSLSSTVVDTSLTVEIDMDGLYLTQRVTPESVITGGEEFLLVNIGPVWVPGGRHQIKLRIDPNYQIEEATKGNNIVTREMVFRPSLAPAGTWVLRDRTWYDQSIFGQTIFGGLASYPTGTAERILAASDFAAAVVRPSSEGGARMELRASVPGSGPFGGFETAVDSVARLAEDIHAMVVHQSRFAGSSTDFTIARRFGGARRGYEFQHVASTLMNPGDSQVVNWGTDDVLGLFEIFFTVIDTGPFSIDFLATVDSTERAEGLHLFWIETGDSTRALLPENADATADSLGRARLDLTVPSTGSYCLAVLRDVPSGRAPAAMSFSLSTTSTPKVDFAPFAGNSFWEAPFIPSLIPTDGVKVSFPLDLLGESLSTYLNFSIFNNSQVAAPGVAVDVSLDGLALDNLDIGALGALGSTVFNSTTPVQVPGGRHTLVMSIDPTNTVAEADETNNMLGMQLGWTGPSLALGSALNRSAPPSPDAGVDQVQIFTRASAQPNGEEGGTEFLNFAGPNSDGLRMPQLLPKKVNGNWLAVGAVPGDQSDVDLRLHEVTTPSRAFLTALNESQCEGEATEYLMVNFAHTPSRAFDVGVLNMGGTANYDAQLVQSDDLGAPGDGISYGPFTVGGGDILSLQEFQLVAGDYQLVLEADPSASLELALHAPLSPYFSAYHSKSDAGLNAQTTAFPLRATPNTALDFTVLPGEEGNYCVVVFPTDRAAAGTLESFQLKWSVLSTNVPLITVDGQLDQAYGPPLAVQGVQTQFGDNDDPDAGLANGSELDALHGRIDKGVLYLMLTGNLESNFNDLEIFVDSKPGGQNRLRGDNPAVDGDGLNRMGDDGGGNGLRFDPGFDADYYFTLSGGESPYRMVASWAELLDTGGGSSRLLGGTVEQSTGLLSGPNVSNPDRVRVTLDNSNVQGVGAGTAAANGDGVFTGVEWAIPLSAIGNPTGCVRVCVFVNGREHDFVSNQVLGGVPVGTANLGEPRSVDFSGLAGNQYVIVCEGTSTDIGDVPDRPRISELEFHAPIPNPFNPRTRLRFALPEAATVDLQIYDVAGRLVRSVAVAEAMDAGEHELVWDGVDGRGRRVSSGAYFARLSAGGGERTQRLLLVK